jgi:guanine deaminase
VTRFETKVQQAIEAIEREGLRANDAAIAERRLAWLDRVLPELGRETPWTPRTAYELLFFRRMGLDPADLPVVSESEKEIIWLSRNRCPLLEACEARGWDTRRVCRGANERATQAFFSRLDPQLRFYRSYTEIRPHAPHCRESIVRVDFQAMMRVAIEEAQHSREEGNHGYGAVVVHEGRIVARAHDTADTEGDPSMHAEVNAIRAAARALGDADLCGAILFSTCEPCPMCASLAVWANVTTIVYGASIAETAAMGRERITVGAQEIVDRSPAAIEVIGGVLGEGCRALYR